MAEMWDLYDKDRMPLGRLHERGIPLNNGEFHIVVNILSVNSDGKILITKRHPEKPFSNKWEITGGSAVVGETSLAGATRELLEETGLAVSESDLECRGSITNCTFNSFYDYYLYKGDFSEKDIVLQDGETIDARLVTPEELFLMRQTGEFIDFEYDRMRDFFPEIFYTKHNVVGSVHHISLTAPTKEKFDETIKFYCDILGFSVYRQWETGVMINANGCIIEIFLKDVTYLKGIINHFALGTDDVDKCIDLVRDNGYKVIIEPNSLAIPSSPPVELRMGFVEGALGEEIEFFKAF